MNHLNTFSIVARNPVNKLLAVGGTTHWFQYSMFVPFIKSGIGAIATQAETNLDYGWKSLNLLKKGLEPSEIIKIITDEDENKEIRQVAIINSNGKTSGFTGNKCTKFYGGYFQDNFAVIGNMLENDTVIKAIKDYYLSSTLPFELKIIKALKAGQIAGGDLRGRRSAGLLVVKSDIEDRKPLVNYSYNLRIDDNPKPLEELERLYFIAKAYRLMNEGDIYNFETNNHEKALKMYKEALELQPENQEIKFWYARMAKITNNLELYKKLMCELRSISLVWDELEKRTDELV